VTPLLLIKPVIWLFSAIMTVLVALFSAITGNYYAAIPRDGSQAGVVVYLPPSGAGDSGVLSIELASGTVFRANFSSVSPLSHEQRQLLGPHQHDHALALALLASDSGNTMRCEFALERAGLGSSGVCRDGLGKIYDLKPYPAAPTYAPLKPWPRKTTG